MGTNYMPMGRETVKGQMTDLPELPDEGGESSGMDGAARAKETYSGPEKRCANCQNFDGEGQCNLGKFPADPDGTCEEFKVAGGEEGQETESEEDEMPDLEGME